MNIVDLIILIALLFGAFMGFVRGFFKQTITFIGTILVVILSFILKNPLSMVLYENLPFFEMGGLTALNILLYEILAFMICLAVLSMVLGMVISISGIVENLLKMTVILALPSKLLGMIVGIIQSVVIIYVVLFIISMPIFKVPYISESKYANFILKNTPIVSNITKEAVDAFNEIKEFTTNKIDIKDIRSTNRNIVEILLKNDIVTTDSVELLDKKDKIDIDNVDELISKYKKEEE